MEDSRDKIQTEAVEVIEAVLGGQRERYRDLVDRHADKVYAVAWSRLGDRHLAEEVVQETFIQGYQRLNQLKDPSKFLSWIVRIARNTAINLGIRHRNELKKRRRWAFEQPSPTEELSETEESNDSGEPVNKETLSEIMSGMRVSYRECLTLFYLEGKSIEASAQSLNITPGNFKTRLHRARTALRTQLEHHIEIQLNKLKPSEKARHAIMAVVVLKAPGSYGLKAFGVSVASLPVLNWFLFGAQFLSLLQMSLLWKWLDRLVMRNFKDPKSYEAQSFQSQSKRNLLMVLGMAIMFMVLAFFATRLNGMQFFAALFCIFVLQPTILLITQGPTTRHSMHLKVTLGIAIAGLGMIGYFFMQWPNYVQQFCFAGFIFLNTWATRNFPMGRDFSLFSRLAHRHSDDDVSTECEPVPIEPPNVQKSEIRSFVTYLAKEFHVVSMRSVNNGIWVRTTPYKSNPFSSILYAFWWKGASVIFLGYHGEFEAKLGQGDISKLPAHLFKGDLQKDQERINKQVTAGIRSAFTHWRLGDFKLTKKALGLGGDSDTFHVSPEKAKGNRMRVRLGIGCSIFLMVLSLSQFLTEEMIVPLDLWQMKEISLQEQDVRDFLNLLADGDTRGIQARKTFEQLRAHGHASPPVEFYSPTALSAVNNTFQREFDKLLEDRLIDTSYTKPAVYLSFMTQSYIPYSPVWEIQELNTTDWLQILDKKTPDWKVVMSGQYEGYTSIGIWPSTLHKQILFLQDGVNLEQLDFEETHKIIANNQYLDTTLSVGRNQPIVLEDMHGLFFLNNNDPFTDTWQALSILDLTGGLDSIDREACIEGLLRNYFGKGRFYVRSKKSRYKINGGPRAQFGARDTWAGFHSFRILNALDRVDDLDKWQFLLPSNTKRKVDVDDGEWPYSWFEIEAWCMQQEFRNYLRTMKDTNTKN